MEDIKKDVSTQHTMSKFIDLTDLLYIPIHAVSKSNMKLSSNILELISSAADLTKEGDDEILRLKTINIAYDQIKKNEEATQDVETVELKIPLLSVIPLTSLQVQESYIDFDTEIGDIYFNDTNQSYEMEARVCAESPRPTDHFPKIQFEVALKAVSPPEGLSRLLDTLNANPIPKSLSSNPIDAGGRPMEGASLAYVLSLKEKWHRRCRLKKALIKLDQVIDSKKKLLSQPSSSTDHFHGLADHLKTLEDRRDILAHEIHCLTEQLLLEEVDALEGGIG